LKKLLKITLIIVLLFALTVASILVKNQLGRDPDTTYELRGRYKTSPDGKTYLVIEDDNGGKCGPLYVDKKLWPYGLNEKGEVVPGDHSIECGTWMGVTIKEGTIYYFDYWGP
jgi:hypothetical protein